MRATIVPVLAIGLVACAAHAGGVVFYGKPTTKIECDESGCTRFKMNASKSSEYAATVTRGDDLKLQWASREGRALLRARSGVYSYYISPDGGGYIKISTLDDTYMEHVTLGLASITYWGEVTDGAEE